MAPKVKANWRYGDLCFIVAEAQKALERGDQRLSASTRWWPALAITRTGGSVDEVEWLKSDRMMDCGNEQIEAEYFEEVRLLESLMAKHGVHIADKAPKGMAEVGEKFIKAIGRSARAAVLWDLYAIPWRFRGDKVFIIHAPRDLNGAPVIHEMDKEGFIRRQMTATAEAEAEVARLNSRNEWLTYALTGLILVVAVAALLLL